MSIIIVFALIAASNSLTLSEITNTAPPAINCPSSLCDGKIDGNYELSFQPNYFLQCLGGMAYCPPCFPLHLVFVQRCNQCLYSNQDTCATTNPWQPATTFSCPDECPFRGPAFDGNVADPRNRQQYVACWNGLTLGCIACPAGLEFNEQWNACLYEGIYKTRPLPPA